MRTGHVPDRSHEALQAARVPRGLEDSLLENGGGEQADHVPVRRYPSDRGTVSRGGEQYTEHGRGDQSVQGRRDGGGIIESFVLHDFSLPLQYTHFT